MGELIFNGFLLIFFAAMLVYSGQIEIWNGHVWARYWPMIILAVGVLLFAIKTWGVFRKLPKEELKFDIKIFGFKERNIQMLLVSFAWLIFYALILPKAGFIISTFIFCVGMQLLLRGKLLCYAGRRRQFFVNGEQVHGFLACFHDFTHAWDRGHVDF